MPQSKPNSIGPGVSIAVTYWPARVKRANARKSVGASVSENGATRLPGEGQTRWRRGYSLFYSEPSSLRVFWVNSHISS